MIPTVGSFRTIRFEFQSSTASEEVVGSLGGSCSSILLFGRVRVLRDPVVPLKITMRDRSFARGLTSVV